MTITHEEPAFEPDLPIVDPHLHHWEIFPGPGSQLDPQTFLQPEARAMVERSGHAITHTVFVECHALYRADGPDELKSLGETEFVNGIAAMGASGKYGATRFAHRIVGNVDLCLGDRAEEVLERHVAAAGGRFAGIRHPVSWSKAEIFGRRSEPELESLMSRPSFRDGARALARMGLSLDVWCLHTQLGELIDLADAVPDLTIVLDHLGTPESQGEWRGRAAEARAEWAERIRALAERPDVRIKLGGMGMDMSRSVASAPGRTASADLAKAWRPYIETCIEAFSPPRCMFESNFPPDQAAATYGATWNAFKIVAKAASAEEKDWLFRRTASETYKF